MRILSGALMMLLARQSNAANTDYSTNGDNWADVTAGKNAAGADVTISNIVCKSGKSQGPIDLNSKTTPSKEKDAYFHYENVIGDIDGKYIYEAGGVKAKAQGSVYWSDKSSAIYATLDNTGLASLDTDPNGGQLPAEIPTKERKFHTAPNWFETPLAAEYGGATDGKYWAKQFHFHWESEHTIDGKLFDLEMHIVHQGKDKPDDAFTGEYPLGKLGVMGVIFDVDDYDKDKVSNATIATIDKFFDNLMYEKIDSRPMKDGKVTNVLIAEEIALGELMSALNLGDRYVYTGSLTTPPCYQNVFFNMLSTVYPIKQYHLDYYKKVIQARA